MRHCWGITDGSAGMQSQVKALASALGIAPVMKTAKLRAPFGAMPVRWHAGLLRRFAIPFLLHDAVDFAPPMPDLVISCGKRGAMAALGLRAHYPDAKTRFIHIQDPRIDPRYFDLVVAMAHDKVNAPNVLKTRFALHTVTPQALQGAALHFAPRFAGYGRPLAAVLLGGSTHKYRMTEAAMRAIIASLQRLLDHSPCSLLITPSRRTGVGYIEMLNQAFAGNPRVYVYDFCGENPYMGMLALADAIIVTDDSVNMMSEACATGKPLYILPLAGHVDTKPERFAAQLLHDRIARRLDGALETWPYEVIDEMSGLAQEIKERFSLAEV